jgi:Asp-tRNA(Asn)/Glu-tRNA(Gln) amidotransferase A subunit family amidase
MMTTGPALLDDCNISALSAIEVVAAIEGGRLKAETVCAHYLGRSAERQGLVRAWAHIDPENALKQARLAARDPAVRRLRGVPIAVKDLSDTAEMPTSYGSVLYDGNRPASDAACVAMARAAGAVVLGKAATVEFGASRPCETRNPHNMDHTPGGSSAGSAAAVADGQALLATGSQTGGSIIRPAAFCGVVGFKPSFGALSPAGTRAFCWSLDTVGVFARNVPDATLFYRVLRGSAGQAAPPSVPPRIGRFAGPFDDRAEHYQIARLAGVERLLELNCGHVDRLKAEPAFARTLDWQRAISRYEMARSLAYEWNCCRNQLSEELRTEIAEGLELSESDYLAAKNGGHELARHMAKIFREYDAILTFATPGEAPAGLHTTGDATFNRPWSLLGFPCISLPVGTGPKELPLAIQLIGAPFGDERLLRAVTWLERILGRETIHTNRVGKVS